jgi:hypothetical protein
MVREIDEIILYCVGSTAVGTSNSAHGDYSTKIGYWAKNIIWYFQNVMLIIEKIKQISSRNRAIW